MFKRTIKKTCWQWLCCDQLRIIFPHNWTILSLLEDEPALLQDGPYTVFTWGLLHASACGALLFLHVQTHTNTLAYKCWMKMLQAFDTELWMWRLSDPGVAVIDILPNRCNKERHETLRYTQSLAHTNTHDHNVTDNGSMMPAISTSRLIRAKGRWQRTTTRPTLTQCWWSEWWGCHGDRGASAWGRTPGAEELPVLRYLSIWVKEKTTSCVLGCEPLRGLTGKKCDSLITNSSVKVIS